MYERWIHELVAGPMVAQSQDADQDRRRGIRTVFAVECVLVTGFLTLAHVLLELNWKTGGPWTARPLVLGAVLGVVGCALALSSDLVTRRYRSVH